MKKNTLLTKGPGLSDLTEAVRGRLPPLEAGLTGGTEKRAAMGCGVEEAELNDGVAEKVTDLLLLRLVPAES
jgi:hypothetical protein